MDQDRILDKIKKCLEMAKGRGSNPNEAEIALRHAHKLMEAYNLEMGDVLFSLVNVARKMGVQAEEALRATCGKFRTRWAFMEGAAAGQGRRVEDLSMEEMEELWQLSKALEGDGLG